MLDFWVKFKEIHLYVEHEVDNLIIVDDMLLLIAEESDVAGIEVDREGDVEWVKFDWDGVVERVEAYATSDVGRVEVDEEGATATGIEDSDEHDSLVGSDEDEEHEDGERRRNKFPLYNDHNYQGSLKMKLREIQRRSASEMHVNVNIDCYYRAKKIVEKMAGNHKEEFGQVWDYTHKLRSKIAGSTIKMVVQTVTVDSPPYFKRFYVCFDVLKRGWEARCGALIGLDGYFLKDPFKSEFLTTVGRDANNQIFPIA
ncbi:hypothetical protein PVK06_012546 [Gossypium arboreum]|uniref:Uncharacterized protein n=1 Tax=Gossypium arboreum TaxID=29729 RepID=A0ABR0QBR5_GOSAR|nr:hypothetical protein PVK06_012546 [Gossypium arboreum]